MYVKVSYIFYFCDINKVYNLNLIEKSFIDSKNIKRPPFPSLFLLSFSFLIKKNIFNENDN